MAKKGRKIDTRTILIVLLIILIIAAAYIVITNLPEEEDFITPGEVLNNTDYYLNKGTFIVRGYYILDGGIPYAVSTLSTTERRDVLRLDLSSLEETLVTDTMYEFTGVLTIDADSPGYTVIFIVESADDV